MVLEQTLILLSIIGVNLRYFIYKISIYQHSKRVFKGIDIIVGRFFKVNAATIAYNSVFGSKLKNVLLTVFIYGIQAQQTLFYKKSMRTDVALLQQKITFSQPFSFNKGFYFNKVGF